MEPEYTLIGHILVLCFCSVYLLLRSAINIQIFMMIRKQLQAIVATLAVGCCLQPLQAKMPAGTETVRSGMKQQVWVAPDGNDLSAGTAEFPFATLQAALSHVRALRQSADAGKLGEVHIVLKGGTYRLNSTLTLTPDDSGTPTSPTIIEAAEGQTVVLSGGAVVSGWQDTGIVDGLPAVAQGNVWKAAIPVVNGSAVSFRQMWAGTNKMRRASTFDDQSLPRLISVDKTKGELTVPRIEQTFRNPGQVEMTIIQDWVTNVMRVKSIMSVGERSVLKFQEPESAIEFKRPWPILRADEASHSNHMFYFSNAIELLNRPQEWYSDEAAGELYYWPRSGEEKQTFEAVVPVLETLVDIAGTDEWKVQHIAFRGITFAHSSWLRPSVSGHVPLQAGQWLHDAYTDPSSPAGNVAWVGRPKAAVSVTDACSVSFEGCHFRQTASTGLDFVSGTKRMTVRGCTFSDIGGSAILAGYFGDKDFEAHQAYHPVDLSVVCDTIVIDNNYIAHVATEDWGCLGVCIGFAANVSISHNEIFDTPYSAISMGWGWTKDTSCMHDNHITGNYIHSFSNQMRDGGAIYTLSSQPRSSVERNRIEDVGDPKFNPLMWDMRHAQFDIYLDEGSDYFTVKDNWCERGEVNKNKNGGHNTWGTNNSSVSATVKDAAGLEPGYWHLRQSVPVSDMAPVDSIGDDNSGKDRVEYIAPGEGFKLGNAMAVDLNGDNRLDIVYAGGESHQVQQGGVRINMGNYSFAATQGLRRVYMSNFAAGDLNGDGHIDLLQAGWDFWDSYNALWMNDGTGRLTEQRLVSAKNTSPACGIADVNNDGLSDFFFVGNKTDNSFYLQRQDRTFAPAVAKLKLPGGFSDPSMVYADFNNDRSVDICLLSNKTGGVYTRMFFNDGKGNFTERNVGLSERGTRGGMAYADVNGDGYLDLVVGGYYYGEQWNSTAADGGKVVTLYLNNGDGTFAKHQEFSEYLFDNVTQPVRFCDWDNDGYADLIVTGWNMSQGNVSRTDIYLNDGQGNFTLLPDTRLPGVSESSVELADFGNSGRNDILISGNCNGHYQGMPGDRRIAVLCRNRTANTNTAPTAPVDLKTEVGTDGTVHLSWDAGADNETPTPSLSYNYYLRNLSTGLYMTFPNADIATGQRRVSQMGNAWLNHGWTLNNLPPGNYVWSVQTIDASYTGSPFAAEQQFTISESTAIREHAASTDSIRISVVSDGLQIETGEAQAINVFMPDGRKYLTCRLQPGINRVSLPRGLYIVHNTKVIIR